MTDQRGQQLLRSHQIVAELRAAEGVAHRIKAVNGGILGRKPLAGNLDDAGGGVVHAANRIDDPDLVADADRAIRAAEAIKGASGVLAGAPLMAVAALKPPRSSLPCSALATLCECTCSPV